MADTVHKTAHIIADPPAAAVPQVLRDRSDLAFIAVERTRMPMVVSDPRLPDNPIVLANKAFLDLGGYSAEEVLGRNCRFLQGPETDPAVVEEVARAICDEQEITVELLNYRKDGSAFWNELFISPVHDDAGRLLYFFSSSKDISNRRQARELEVEEHRLLREVDHRAKNALALVQGIVRLTRSDSVEAYAQSVQARVDALARAHSLLAAQRWRGVSLARLIQIEAEPFGTKRILLDGPDIELAAEQVQPLGLILHEMLANAAQHGALSARNGTVSIGWMRQEANRLALEWRETGGPPPPLERLPSFGSTLIGATIERQLDGRVSFDWKPTGLESRLEFVLRAPREAPKPEEA